TQIQEFIEEFVNRIVPRVDPESNSTPESSNETAETSPSATEAGANEETPIAADPAEVAANDDNDSSNTDSSSSALDSPPPIQDERIVAGQKEAAQYIYTFIQKTNSEALGATGIFFLFITVVLTLTRIEDTFNDIWGVAQGRDWWTRTTNYLTAIIFGPILLIVAVGLGSSPRIQGVRSF